jgi:hypothetical protein
MAEIGLDVGVRTLPTAPLRGGSWSWEMTLVAIDGDDLLFVVVQVPEWVPTGAPVTVPLVGVLGAG